MERCVPQAERDVRFARDACCASDAEHISSLRREAAQHRLPARAYIILTLQSRTVTEPQREAPPNQKHHLRVLLIWIDVFRKRNVKRPKGVKLASQVKCAYGTIAEYITSLRPQGATSLRGAAEMLHLPTCKTGHSFLTGFIGYVISVAFHLTASCFLPSHAHIRNIFSRANQEEITHFQRKTRTNLHFCNVGATNSFLMMKA